MISILGWLSVAVLVAACAPTSYYTPATPIPRQPPVETEVFFYPLHGQSGERQDRDRFECYLWARQQTGFDPSLPALAPHQRIHVVARPPTGEETLAGAFTGAVLGAIIGAPHSSGEGAVVGAIAGAALGAAAESARYASETRSLQARHDRYSQERYAEQDRRSRLYRRAMSACLEGRGYSVR
ncbi:MAG: glycine zipper 2TM domain-containing protein [Desulfuromonadales bacterium]|nr:glycine zipper 2TM domain-containing protein [Desulfuromonadales bacterium]